MNERYYYSDIAEMEERFEAFSRQMETFIDDFISIGLNISGLQGRRQKVWRNASLSIIEN